MTKCPNCGKENKGLNQFCDGCGHKLTVSASQKSIKSPAQIPTYKSHASEEYYGSLSNSYVRFILYFICIFSPIIGIILGLLVSITPFAGQKDLSSSMISCSCAMSIIWFIIAIIVICAIFFLAL